MNPWGRLAPRDRRALVVGAVILGGGVTIRLGVLPYLRARTTLVQRLHEQEDLLGRELALAREAPNVTRSVAQATSVLARVRPRLLEARDAFYATALLAGDLGEDARRHGVLIEAIESRTPESLGGSLVSIRIDVRGRGDLEGLLRWLHTIESATRFVRVEQLNLARMETETAADSLDTETLTFAMSIRGFTTAPLGDPSTTVVATNAGRVP